MGEPVGHIRCAPLRAGAHAGWAGLVVLLVAITIARSIHADAPALLAMCSLSATAKEEPPPDVGADPFGTGPWYVNADRTIWASADGAWKARNSRNKVLWIRPRGTQLTVSGRRLDREVPPLTAQINYRAYQERSFQPSYVYVPTEGCWEVTAKAGSSTLTFVTRVE
jgi:hypothetical protein